MSFFAFLVVVNPETATHDDNKTTSFYENQKNPKEKANLAHRSLVGRNVLVPRCLDAKTSSSS